MDLVGTGINARSKQICLKMPFLQFEISEENEIRVDEEKEQILEHLRNIINHAKQIGWTVPELKVQLDFILVEADNGEDKDQGDRMGRDCNIRGVGWIKGEEILEQPQS